MQVLFLAAGENSRMFPLETMTHKGLIFLGGKPLIQYSMEKLTKIGINKFIIVLGNFKYTDEIINYFSNLSFDIKFVIQPLPIGQADAILRAREHIQDDFLIIEPYYLGEDNLLETMLEKFKNESLDGIVGAKFEENISQYGAFEFNSEGDIVNYIEKPEKENAPSNIKKTGIEIYKHEYLEFLEKSIGKDKYPNIHAMVEFAKVRKMKAYVIEKNQFTTTLKYCWDLLDIKDFIFQNENYISKSASINNSSTIENSVIEDNVIIGANSKIKNSIIMKNTVIRDNVIIQDSIIGSDCIIENNVKLMSKDSVVVKIKDQSVKINKNFGVCIGRSSILGKDTIVDPGVLIGQNNKIEENSKIISNIKHND